MATSTLRFLIIVALVVGGVLLIDRAFPSPTSGSSGIGPGPGSSPTTPPPTSPTKPPKSPKTPPTIQGTVIAVYNGTGVLGLAGDVQTKLMNRFGVVAPHPAANAPSTVAETTLYFRSRSDQAKARFLADRFFKGVPNVSVVRLQSGTDVPADVQVAIFLGNDYASLQG